MIESKYVERRNVESLLKLHRYVVNFPPIRFFAVTLFMLAPLFVGCRGNDETRGNGDPSIVFSKYRGGDKNVVNGQAYDKATLEIGEYKCVVVPEEAKVEHDGPAGRIEFYEEKSLHFVGWAEWSIIEERKRMGCASKGSGLMRGIGCSVG
jgi:hypothetical protein